MTLETTINSNKRVSNQLGRIQKGYGIVLTLLIIIPIGFCILPFIVPEILGSISVTQANYSGAKLVYSGYRIVGSSDWQNKSFVYWTSDPINDVKTYYEKQVAIVSFERPVYKGSAINAFMGKSGRLVIILADANQDHVGNLLDSYRDDPYSKIDNLPRTGTIIIMTHDIYSP